jgi:ribosomal protein S21
MKKQRTRKEDIVVVGKPNAFKVVNGDIGSALRLWKKYVKESGKTDILKEKKEHIKPSVLKRKNAELAKFNQMVDTKNYKELNG